ncbi:PfkB family carbohydrate kinase [Streptomyces lichenis]|uniref:PfkB family carbohydrate kinase n=1 Tax=Streptomyces lichenis TaxID=2306967 RepID=A0ABT0IAN4_9ACTN|nr:PfkB family carbohydrate kinase [Streptomyces lichenis]MCK8678386.1 PfkB family carbohydrate kinase [Streptomyces lichenis]
MSGEAAARPVLVVGEALVDLVPAAGGGLRPLPGGAAANVAAALARLGGHAVFAGTLGSDAFGRRCEERLRRAGADLSLCGRSELPTALAVADPDGQSTRYDFHLHATATFELTPPSGGLDRFAAVYAGGLAAVREPAAGAVAAVAERAAALGRLVVDPNVRADRTLDPVDGAQRLRRLCELARVVKASDEDLRALWPDRAPEESCAQLAAGGRLVLLTLGARGSTAFLPGGGRVRAAAPPVRVADTIGAGDAFTAACLDRFAREGVPGPETPEESVRRLLEYAAGVAASVVARPGADLPEGFTPGTDLPLEAGRL